MHPRELSKFIAVVLLILAFLGTLVSGCNIGPTPTKITLTSSPSPTFCPPTTPFPFPSTPTPFPPQQLTHFFILIDISGSYSAHFSSSLNLVNDSLGDIVKPGDGLTIAWLGTNSGQPTEKLFDEISPIPDLPNHNVDDIRPAPMIPTPMNVPPQRGGTTMDFIEQTQTVEAISTLNQANLNAYYCEVMEWNQELPSENYFETPQPPYDYQQFLMRASSVLLDAKNAESQGYTDVYSALWDVSEAFAIDRATNQFQRFVLIVFSDLEGNITYNNVKNNIDLSQSNIIIANYPCNEPNACQAQMNRWTTELKDEFGAQTVDILRPEDTSIQSIVYLSRR